MAITFAQQKRKQQYMILVLSGIVLLTLAIIWWFFLRPAPAPSPEIQVAKPPKITIDFSILQSKFFLDLEPFPKIQPLATSAFTTGRDNPFVPSSATSGQILTK